MLALGPGGEPTNLTLVVPLRGRLKGVDTSSSQKHCSSKGISPYRCNAAPNTHVSRPLPFRTSDIPHLPFANNPADATGFGAACKNSAAPYHPSTPRDSLSRRCDATIDIPMHCGGDAVIGCLFLVFVAEWFMFARTGPSLLIRGSSPLVP